MTKVYEGKHVKNIEEESQNEGIRRNTQMIKVIRRIKTFNWHEYELEYKK